MSATQIRPLDAQMPVDLASAYARAQARFRMSPAMQFSDLYHPLRELVEQGRQFGGVHRVAALQACVAAADADEPALARMAQWKRPAPDMPTGAERAADRHVANAATSQQAVDMAALANRPRVTLAEQLGAMQSRGIRINVQGRHLKVHAPDGVVTDGDRALLREHKAQIIGWLESNEETI